tara:strand:- start:28 stop:576 length:549 start_codon:yes stop_codon:yes gene_type:complete
MIPSLIANTAYRTNVGKNHIEKTIIFSLKDKLNNYAIDFLKNLDIYKSGTMSLQQRMPIAIGLGMLSDIIICHQLQNMDTLSYIYMDAIHMGYPVLHNAIDCKNLGYYYDKNNITKAAKILNDILLNHDKKALKYNTANRKKLNRYKPENLNVQGSYSTLINNLWKEGNSHLNFNKSKNHYV